MRIPLLPALLLAVLASARPASAKDILELANGTKLVGTVIREEGGKIYFHADLIGDVVIDEPSVVKRTQVEPPSVAAIPPPSSAQPAPVVTSAPPAPPATTSVPSSPTTAAAQTANHVFWKRILSFNGSYTSAAYEQGDIKGAPEGFPTGAAAGLQGRQETLQVSGTLIGATPYQAVTLTGSYGYASYQPAGTVMDNHSLEGTYTYVISPNDYWLTRSTYKVDVPAYIKHDFEQVFGFGHKLIDTERTKLDLIPGISMVDDDRGTVWDNKWILSAGFLEHLDYAFNERVSLEQRFKYRFGVEHAEVWDIDSYLGIKAQISTHISLTTGATFTYDNTLGPLPTSLAAQYLAEGVPEEVISLIQPANKDQLLITSGLEYSW